MVLTFYSYRFFSRVAALTLAVVCSIALILPQDAWAKSAYAIAADNVIQLAQETQDEAPQSDADLVSGLPFQYFLYGFLATLGLFAVFRWRDKSTRAKERKREIEASKKKPEIGVVTRNLQKRLPDNRVVRNQIAAGMAPRIRSKPAEGFTATPFSGQRQQVKNNPKVLIIDESREMRMSLGNQLNRYYSILESNNLTEALRIARIARPELIILGVQSEKVETIAFCRKLKSDAALWGIPILTLVTGKQGNDAAQLIKATDDYLIAPLQPAELLVAVENLVDVRSYLKKGGLIRPQIKADDSTTQISDTMFLDAVYTVVENNLSNSLFGLETLAQEVNVSIRQLHGRLRKLTRLSPAGFIRTKRLKKAADLIKSEDLNVQEIARMVGFHSPEYFSRVFKQAYGMSPTEYSAA